jgi:hypothetical protein
MTTLIEIFRDAMPIIRSAAPILAGIIGGPMGLVIGNVVPILATAFESDPLDLPQLASRIMNDPDAPAKLQDIENRHSSNWLMTLTKSVNNLEEAELNIKLKWK